MSEVIQFEVPIKPFTQSPRKIWAYLPDSYTANTKKKYPVLYMFDGHNLFFDDVATYGKSWGIKDYLDKAKLDLVVIGQDCNHIDNGRMHEYCPVKPVKVKGWEDTKKRGDITAKWFAEVLKPYCEKKFSVYSDRNHVGIGGSSMGGLMADYMATQYSDVFGKFACISPATEFGKNECLKLIHHCTLHSNTRLYRSFGANEIKNRKTEMKMINTLLELSNAFTAKGGNVYNRIILNGTHSEATWETIVPECIDFLFPELKTSKKNI